MANEYRDDLKETTRVSVVIPCHNEEPTIGKVVSDFRRELPFASVYVFDNCCTDATCEVATKAGAEVIKEYRKGKGFVVESIFANVDSDIYVMVDGDDTYPAEAVHKLIRPVMDGQADMAVGNRLVDYSEASFRPLHFWGNNLVRKLVNWIWGSNLRDVLSGYRVFNKKLVERVPVVSKGFEIETELTVQVLYYHLRIVEIDVSYRSRPEGSGSKLSTFSDGTRILWKLFNLCCAFKPLTFFGSISLNFFALSLLAGILPVKDYICEPRHYVSHLPLAILAVSLMILSFGSAFVGVLLHFLSWRFRELHNVLTRTSLKQWKG